MRSEHVSSHKYVVCAVCDELFEVDEWPRGLFVCSTCRQHYDDAEQPSYDPDSHELEDDDFH